MSCQSNKSHTHTYWLPADSRCTQPRDPSNMMYITLHRTRHLFCLTFVFIFKCNISLNHFLVTLQFPLTAFHCSSIITGQVQTKIHRMTEKSRVQPAAGNQSHRRWRAGLVWENSNPTHRPRDQSNLLVPPALLYISVPLLAPRVAFGALPFPAFQGLGWVLLELSSQDESFLSSVVTSLSLTAVRASVTFLL